MIRILALFALLAIPSSAQFYPSYANAARWLASGKGDCHFDPETPHGWMCWGGSGDQAGPLYRHAKQLRIKSLQPRFEHVSFWQWARRAR